MAPRTIYTRRNPDPDPNPPKVVEDPERILRRKKRKVDSGIPLISRSVSFPKEGFISVDYLQFYMKFEQSLFKSKLDSDLVQIVFHHGIFNTFIPNKISCFSKEEREEFWNYLTT